MKVLYVAKRGKYNVPAVNHLRVLKEIFGESEVFVIDLLDKNAHREPSLISYGYNKYSPIRIVRWLQGNEGFISNSIIRELIFIIKENDIKIVFSEESDLGYLVKRIKKEVPSTYIICFFHDILAQLFRQRKQQLQFWRIHNWIEYNLGIMQERITVKYADEKWVFHETDYERYVYWYKNNPDGVLPICGPEPNINYTEKKKEQPTETKIILFVCSKYYVNLKGFMWFYRHVLPGMIGNFHIIIVGTGSEKLRKGIHDKRITIVGAVDSVERYYQKADIVIMPVFDGGGMKVKTWEAVSYGKCFVSTTESLNGYWEAMDRSVRDKIVFRCDNPEEWIETMNKIVNSNIPKFNKELYEVFKKNFSYERLKMEFERNLLKRALEGCKI